MARSTRIILRRIFALLIALWTLINGFALWEAISDRREQVIENEKITASVSYKKDLMYRRWVAKQGGVYVRITEHTPPNQYLTFIKNREIVTTTGDTFTLVNPAYMSRQVLELSKKDYNLPGRLVSLKPLNPNNTPDEWERAALKAFEKGDTLFTQETFIEGKRYMRHIQPFKTEKSCLKCHAFQGYEVGDVRGAISIAVPVGEFEAVMKQYIGGIVINYIILWSIGIAGIVFAFVKIRKHLILNAENETIIMQQNEEMRTLIENLNKTNNQIKAKNDELDTLNATKDKFFSIIAHDLKSPFTSLIGYSKMLTKNFEKYSDEKKKNYIMNIEKASSSTYQLLENLLTWSRSQTGKLNFEPQNVLLKQLCLESYEPLMTIAENKNISIHNTINAEWKVFVDSNLIQTILRNLISNALKFTYPAGAIHISATELDTQMIEISVTDNGMGMDSKTMESLFKIDSKTSNIGTNDEEGTGLGLILCKEFVEKHGGKIWVESTISEGSTFKFSVPKGT